MTLLAAGTEAEEFKGVEQELEAFQLLAVGMGAVHRAVIEDHGAAAVHAGEVMLIPLGGGVKGLAAGEMAAAHQAPLLQLAQMPVHGGEPHRLVAAAQLSVEILAREFCFASPQRLQEAGLPFAEGRRDHWSGLGQDRMWQLQPILWTLAPGAAL